MTDLAPVDTGRAPAEVRRPPLTRHVETDLAVALQVLQDQMDYLATCQHRGALGERLANERKSIERSIDYLGRLREASAQRRDDDSDANDARRPPLTKQVEADLPMAVRTLQAEAAYLATDTTPGALGEQLAAKHKAVIRILDYLTRLLDARAQQRGDASPDTTPTP